MTIRSQDLRDGRPAHDVKAISGSTSYKVAAIVVWLLGVAATHQLLMALGMASRVAFPAVAFWFGLFIAFAVQALLTVLERPVLIGRPNTVSLFVLGIDTLINAGGVYPFAARLGATPTVEAIAAATAQPPAISPLAAFALSVIVGFILAATPEAAWRWRG